MVDEVVNMEGCGAGDCGGGIPVFTKGTSPQSWSLDLYGHTNPYCSPFQGVVLVPFH